MLPEKVRFSGGAGGGADEGVARDDRVAHLRVPPELAARRHAGRRVVRLRVARVEDQRVVDDLDVVVVDQVVVLAEPDSLRLLVAIAEDEFTLDDVVDTGPDVDGAGAGADRVEAEGVRGSLQLQDLRVAAAVHEQVVLEHGVALEVVAQRAEPTDSQRLAALVAGGEVVEVVVVDERAGRRVGVLSYLDEVALLLLRAYLVVIDPVAVAVLAVQLHEILGGTAECTAGHA